MRFNIVVRRPCPILIAKTDSPLFLIRRPVTNREDETRTFAKLESMRAATVVRKKHGAGLWKPFEFRNDRTNSFRGTTKVFFQDKFVYYRRGERTQMTQNKSGSSNPEDVPRSASGRTPNWVFEELQGKKVEPEAWRSPSTFQKRSIKRQQYKRSARNIIPLIVLISIVGISIAARNNTQWQRFLNGSSNSAQPTRQSPQDQPQIARSATPQVRTEPDPDSAESSTPLGYPAPLTTSSNSFKFMDYQSNGITPVSYDPCRQIHFVIRQQGAPIGGNEIITQAFSRVSQATGLQFVYDGPSTEAPSFRRAAFQLTRYGNRWAPVLIAWASIDENPDFVVNVEGESGSDAVSRGSGPKIYVTGVVELDAVKLGAMLQSPGGTKIVYAIVLHELGHLIGLAHVIDKNQLMFPASGQGPLDFAAGDLNGAYRLGTGQCASNL